MDNTLTAQEIKEIRGMYGLSQKSFALLLGIGPASMVRYEQGAKPSKANANLIRAARRPEFMMECLERDKDLIPRFQSERAEKYVYAMVSLDGEEAPMTTTKKAAAAEKRTYTMDEMYHYTLQQEVLNEQAANIIGELISIEVDTGFVGDAGDVLDGLLNQVSRIKPTIVTEQAMNDLRLSEIRGYLKCASELVARYRAEVA